MATVVKGRQQAIIKMDLVINELRQRVTNGLNAVGENMLLKAQEDVPQRKVFRYGRTTEGLRFESRQSVRTLTPGEVNRERGRIGAGAGYRGQGPGKTPAIQTTWFPEFEYRSVNRANSGGKDPRSRRVPSETRRTIEVQPVTTVLPGIGNRRTTGERVLTDEYAKLDLSAAGRYEFEKRRHKEDDPTGKNRYKKGDFVHKSQLGGALLRSIIPIKATPSRRPRFILQAGGEDAPYAKYVEFGTRHSKAQPFLRPALAQARGELVGVIVAYLRKPG